MEDSLVQKKQKDTPITTCSSPIIPPKKQERCDQNNGGSVAAGVVNGTVCMECRTNRFQYICPRCAFKSCSLQCCKAHKERLPYCNGKRNRTSFVPIRRMNDATLQSDYHFLEDVCAQVERTTSAQSRFKLQQGEQQHKHSNNHQFRKRMRQDGDNEDNGNTEHIPPHPLLQHPPTFAQQSVVSIPAGLASSPPALRPEHHNHHQPNSIHHVHHNMHPKLRHFATLAWERYRIQILYMPSGMQRRVNNKSYIQQASRNNRRNNKSHNNNDKNSPLGTDLSNQSVFYWTLEWRLHNPTPPSTDDQNNGTAHHHDDNADDKDKNGTTTATTITSSTIVTAAAAPTNNIMTSTSAISEKCSVGDALVLHLSLQTSQDKKNSPMGESSSSSSSSSLLEHYTVMMAMSNQQQRQQTTMQPRRYYRKVSMESTIAEALQDCRIIEYPTFEIVHASRLDEFPQFIQTIS